MKKNKKEEREREREEEKERKRERNAFQTGINKNDGHKTTKFLFSCFAYNINSTPPQPYLIDLYNINKIVKIFDS